MAQHPDVWKGHHWDDEGAASRPWVVTTSQDSFTESFENDHLVFLIGPTNEDTPWRRPFLESVTTRCPWGTLRKRVVFVIPETRSGFWNNMMGQKFWRENPKRFFECGAIIGPLQLGWEQKHILRILGNPESGTIASWADVSFSTNIGPTYRFECGQCAPSSALIHGEPRSAEKMDWMHCALSSDWLQQNLAAIAAGGTGAPTAQDVKTRMTGPDMQAVWGRYFTISDDNHHTYPH
ncbi:hypothetical protein Pelo_5744 [Pelomyxa schiedti]|nr:hypothetical protein Pelo_5744 [Pelomyxa schiedti]